MLTLALWLIDYHKVYVIQNQFMILYLYVVTLLIYSYLKNVLLSEEAGMHAKLNFVG